MGERQGRLRRSGEQPELPTPQPAGGSARLEARAAGGARINQAGRDLHVHYPDGVRRVEPGAKAMECPYPGLASVAGEQAGGSSAGMR